MNKETIFNKFIEKAIEGGWVYKKELNIILNFIDENNIIHYGYKDRAGYSVLYDTHVYKYFFDEKILQIIFGEDCWKENVDCFRTDIKCRNCFDYEYTWRMVLEELSKSEDIFKCISKFLED